MAIQLPAPPDDETWVRKNLGTVLLNVRDVVGEERYIQAIGRLRRSDELAQASCREAAEALATLGGRHEDLMNSDEKERLKLAREATRLVLFWRSCGSALGLDSRGALVDCFELVTRYANCHHNTVNRLTNIWRSIKRMLRGQGGQQEPEAPV